MTSVKVEHISVHFYWGFIVF